MANTSSLAIARFFIFAMLGCGLMLIGCEPVRTDKTEDMPWTAPGKQADFRVKDNIALGAGPTAESWWEDASRNHHDPYELWKDANMYLAAAGISKDWPEVFKRRLAPYDFTIVSITPSVILMKPRDFGPYNEETFGHIENNELYVSVDGMNRRQGIAPRRLINVIRYGTVADYDPNLQWFSPDLSQGPSPIIFSSQNVTEIPLPNGKLVLTRQGNQVIVARE